MKSPFQRCILTLLPVENDSMNKALTSKYEDEKKIVCRGVGNNPADRL